MSNASGQLPERCQLLGLNELAFELLALIHLSLQRFTGQPELLADDHS
jgi:hypothetical protein